MDAICGSGEFASIEISQLLVRLESDKSLQGVSDLLEELFGIETRTSSLRTMASTNLCHWLAST
jgi:hypothetical protein